MNVNVAGYRPIAKALLSFSKIKITSDTVIMVKADGDFNYFSYVRGGEAYTLNKWGTKRSDLPCILELKMALDRQALERVELLLELYAVEDGRMLKLPNYIHEVKAGDVNKVRAGIFDLISVNDKGVHDNYAWKLEELERWLNGCKRCYVLPYTKPKTLMDVEQFWNEWVEGKGYEGLFVRGDGDLYKVKKHATVDAVIIGINKRPKLIKGEVTSIKVALMDEEERFIELSDVASGIDHALRKRLYPLTAYKIGADDETIYIAPMIVVEVEFTETFEKYQRVFEVKGKKIREENILRKSYSLRHPRLLSFRTDKTVNPVDLRLDQIA